MRRNLNALLLLLLVCAVGASLLRGSEREELRADLQRSLELLWGGKDHQVVLGGGGARIHAEVRVSAACLRGNRASWNYQFLRFVARRHPALSLESLSLRDLESGSEVAEQAVTKYPYDTPFEPARSKLRRRQLQNWLDQTVGAENGLALVDGAPGLSLAGDETLKLLDHGYEPWMTNPESVLVINGRIRGIEKLQTVDWSQYPDLRLLVLP